LIFTFLDTTSTAVPDRAIPSAGIPDQAILADGLDNTCGDIQATIQEGRALLQEVSGGYTGGEDDAVMGDETAHKKRSKDDICDKDYVDPDL
jgi:hypothetical protein